MAILCRTRRGDDRGIDDGAGLERDAACLQHSADLGKQLLAQLLVFQQVAELEQGGGVQYRFVAKINAAEAA